MALFYTNSSQQKMSNNFQCRCPFCQIVGNDVGKKIVNSRGRKLHICHYCSEIFESTSNLLDHIKSHEKQRSYSCEWPGCDKKFTEYDHMKKHMPSHSREKKYQCEFCDCRFSNKLDFTTHIQSHEDKPRKKRVKCDCPNCQAVKAGGEKVRDSSRGRRLHNCQYCDKAFIYPSDLIKHINFHTKQFFFPCEWPGCEKTFTQSSNMKSHMRKHAKKNIHVCHVCEKSFRRLPYLKRHHKTHDKSEKISPKVVETVEPVKEPPSAGTWIDELDMILDESLQLQSELQKRDFVEEKQQQQNIIQVVEYDPVHFNQECPENLDLSNFEEVTNVVIEYLDNISESEWQEVVAVQWL